MAGFNLDAYEPVQSRIAKFWADHPQGRIVTAKHEAPDGEVLFCAAVFRAGEPEPFATGWAHEVVGQGQVNRTHATENSETSAVGRALGRALANAGYAPSAELRPSREEMAKTQPVPVADVETRARLKARIETLGNPAKAAWKTAGLPRLDRLPADQVHRADQLLDELDGVDLDESF